MKPVLHLSRRDKGVAINAPLKKQARTYKQNALHKEIKKRAKHTEFNKLGKRRTRKKHVPTNVALVYFTLYPILVEASMDVEAAIAMTCIVTNTAKETTHRVGITATWLAGEIHFGFSQCVALLESFCATGYIHELQYSKGDTHEPVDYDEAYTKVYGINSEIGLVDPAAIPVQQKGVRLFHSKDLFVFVRRLDRVRIDGTIVNAIKSRGFVKGNVFDTSTTPI